ncbi:cytochrome c biogenesis protein ResB [Nocardioides sp. HDW12B]|uniref:cytochrome c biogenesis protein ResB n=1 Tax=Nocardioides sp. HDW12B TaxID=2714939 RepID=UPI00140825F0|nr:cytochrome c biogenesis protein ResB [Nocardioides sp. HDW12B]QIK65135.1 cytochrome c biogenesis protein ResB [Nocardioides sp. HDW12B]
MSTRTTDRDPSMPEPPNESGPSDGTDATDARRLASDVPGSPPALSPRELARWAWRQLTSMRTALLLLLLLALGSIPGSVIPQSNIAAVQVGQWKEDHPTLAPIYERLGLFSVYDSVWFSAIYLLLMVSLVGCIVPRLAVHWRAVRSTPPKAPRNLHRLPAYAREELAPGAAAEETLDRAEAALRRRRRYRVVRTGDSLSAERGHLRELGNLVFHISVVVVLLAFAYGQLFGYKGGAIVLVGSGFTNSTPQYDEFAPGSLYDPVDLEPLSFTVDDFDVRFLEGGPANGQPEYFRAPITYREDLDAAPEKHVLEVNKPLVLDGVSVFLVGHGYAPDFTVTDGSGEVAWDAPVPFLPQDATFASFGVLKVQGARPEQLAFDGLFLPTYGFTMERGPFSVFPDARRPVVTMTGYYGDLGLGDGQPQSVYALDTDEMTQFEKGDGTPFRLDMVPGQTVDLPEGMGTVRFNGYERWVKLQISHTPGKGVALGGIVLGLVGLMGSLFVRRRRVWVRVVGGPDGRTSYLEVGGLDRSTVAEGLETEVTGLARTALGTMTGAGDTGRGPGSQASRTRDDEEQP